MKFGFSKHKKEYLVVLSKQHFALSTNELNALFDNEKIELKDNAILIKTKKSTKKIINNAKKSSYIRFIYELIDKTDDKNLRKIKQPYSVKVYDLNQNKKINPRKLADKLWNKFEKNKIKPKVDLKNPQTKLFFLIIGKNKHLTKKIFENDNSELKRKAHLRPQSHPTSLDPKIAKACVNILTSGKKQKIIDPMCGSGGILIEAGLLGNKIEGYDIDEKMISKCDENFRYYGLKQYKLLKKDALLIKKEIANAIVDLPYGKNSKLNKEIKELYKKVLLKISKNSIIMIPDFMEKVVFDELRKQNKEYKILDTIYLHKSLKKIIIKIN